MIKFFKHSFMQDEDGAVSVDWVVLTAAMVGVAFGAIVQIQSATVGLGESVAIGIAATPVGTP